MKLEKAIEIKENRLGDKKPYYSEEIEEADKLSIEAMRRNLNCRNKGQCEYALNLPGETKD